MGTTLVTTEDDWVALRDEWDALLAHGSHPSIFLTFDYLSHAYRTFHRSDATPFLIVVRSDAGELLGIAPLRRTARRRHGVTLQTLEYVTTWEVDKPYVLARSGLEPRCWEEIHRYLHGHPEQWDVLDLIEMPDATRGLGEIKRLFTPRHYVSRVSVGPDGPLIDLAVAWPEFLARHPKLARGLRRLDKQLGRPDILTYDRPDTIEQGIERYVALEALTWKSGKHGLRKNPWHRDFYREAILSACRQGRVAIRLLVRGEEAVAGLICWEFGDTVYIHHTVYNPAYAHLSPGTMFMGLVLGEYMKSGRFRRADLLCGFAEFYKAWAAEIVGTTRVQVYRRSLRTRWLLWLERLADTVRRRPSPPSLQGERRRPAAEEVAMHP